MGPRAGLAGSIAWAALEAMKVAGASFGVCDNGGDIAFLLDESITLGLYS